MATNKINAYKQVFNDIDRASKQGLKGPIKYSKAYDDLRNRINNYRNKDGTISKGRLRSNKAKQEFNNLIAEYKAAYRSKDSGRISKASRQEQMKEDIRLAKIKTYETEEAGKNRPFTTDVYGSTVDNMEIIQKLLGGVDEMVEFFADDAKAIFYKVADMTEAGQITNEETIRKLINTMKERMDNVPASVKDKIKRDDRYEMLDATLEVMNKHSVSDDQLGQILEAAIQGFTTGSRPNVAQLAKTILNIKG